MSDKLPSRRSGALAKSRHYREWAGTGTNRSRETVPGSDLSVFKRQTERVAQAAAWSGCSPWGSLYEKARRSTSSPAFVTRLCAEIRRAEIRHTACRGRSRLAPPLSRLARGRGNHTSGFPGRWRHARLIGHVFRYHPGINQIGAHEPQHLSGTGRQSGNPGISARSKDLREQVLLERNPSAWRFVADKEMPFLPLVQQLRPVIERTLVRRHNLPVRRDEVAGWQFRNRLRLRISLRAVPAHNIQASGALPGCP